MSSHSEPLLDRPVVPGSSEGRIQAPAWEPPGSQSKNQHHSQQADYDGVGCCHFSNNFYLTAAWGFVFAVLCVFQIFMFLTFGYILPTCFCQGFWAHLLALSTNMKLVYVCAILYLTCFTVLGFVCLNGLLQEKKKSITPFLFMLIVTEILIVVGGIVGGVKGTQLYQEKTSNKTNEEISQEMFDLLGLILKKDFVDYIETTLKVIKIGEMDHVNIPALMNHVFLPEFLVQLEAIKQMMMFSGALVGFGINMLLICTVALLLKVIQRMNKFQKFLETQSQATNQQYLQPVTEGQYYSYSPTNNIYSYQSTMQQDKSRRDENEELLHVGGVS